MKALLALVLLAALGACDGRQKAAPVEPNAASQATTNEVAMPPVADPAPAEANMAAPAEAAQGAGRGQTDRFIVCPGNPRCPKNEEGRPPEDVD